MSISRRAVLATAVAALPAVTLLGGVHDAVAATGTTYYIAEDGDDKASGTSESAPWQSVNKVIAAINAGQVFSSPSIFFCTSGSIGAGVRPYSPRQYAFTHIVY